MKTIHILYMVNVNRVQAREVKKKKQNEEAKWETESQR